ncbi:SH3 domain-containing protein [Streptomyces resistomycificus]|uniref:SH3b domain-containing protein n=1 Tax=Streptomyces resistomycificus TaxID=67356 RepID=A0A0L8LIZ2_9ACTN|nr:SH3 domain-containing protein [Streptomyces resistomycificus]KOG38198.1 hypothetical protein ADK37_10720 [Streptomyces resistomycificus]KUN98768.1 hypothetical protein AQJ84_14055 [Streptomyces resistomycificus]
MSLRSRCAIALAVGTLLTTAVTAAPAFASDDWGQTPGNDGWEQGQSGADWGQNQGGDNRRFYRGVVTADSLALRSAPTRGAQVIRYADRGEILNIFCKVGGPSVHGNPLWYQIADGTWAWGPARFIDNIGPAPRWC